MSLNSMLVIAVIIFSFFGWKIFNNYQNSKEYDRVLLNLPTQGDGWIELANAEFQPLMFGKVLYSFDGYVCGVGVLVKEQLPAMLVSDIDTKIGPQLLDGQPLCRFIIDSKGQDVMFTELKDEPLKKKLKAYVDGYSKIKLMIGFEPNEYVLIDSKEAESTFERVWQATMAKKKLL